MHVAECADGVDPAFGTTAVEYQGRGRHQLRFVHQVAVALQKHLRHFHILEFSPRTVDEPLLVEPFEKFEIGQFRITHVKHPRKRISGDGLFGIDVGGNLTVEKGILVDNPRVIFERRMVITETQPEKHIPEIQGPDRAVERKIHLRRKYARLPEGERHFAAQPAVSRLAADIELVRQNGRRIGIFRGTILYSTDQCRI